MRYAVYKRMNLEAPYTSNDLQMMNDVELQAMVVDFLMDEVKVEEDMLIDLSFNDLLDLYEETLLDMNEEEGYSAFDRVLIVDERNKVIIDV